MKITNKYNLPKAFLEMAQSDYQHKVEEIESKFYDYYEQIRSVKV